MSMEDAIVHDGSSIEQAWDTMRAVTEMNRVPKNFLVEVTDNRSEACANCPGDCQALTPSRERAALTMYTEASLKGHLGEDPDMTIVGMSYDIDCSGPKRHGLRRQQVCGATVTKSVVMLNTAECNRFAQAEERGQELPMPTFHHKPLG